MPIVIAGVADPVGLGLAAELLNPAHPLGPVALQQIGTSAVAAGVAVVVLDATTPAQAQGLGMPNETLMRAGPAIDNWL